MSAGVHARERADVSFRDVTIKIPDRGYDQGCEWRHAPETWAEIWEKLVEIETWARPDEFVRYGRRALVGLPADDVKAVSIEGLYLSPYVEKPLNSKVIKIFVPELRSRKCFSCFGIPMFYVYSYVTERVRQRVTQTHNKKRGSNTNTHWKKKR